MLLCNGRHGVFRKKTSQNTFSSYKFAGAGKIAAFCCSELVINIAKVLCRQGNPQVADVIKANKYFGVLAGGYGGSVKSVFRAGAG